MISIAIIVSLILFFVYHPQREMTEKICHWKWQTGRIYCFTCSWWMVILTQNLFRQKWPFQWNEVFYRVPFVMFHWILSYLRSATPAAQGIHTFTEKFVMLAWIFMLSFYSWLFDMYYFHCSHLNKGIWKNGIVILKFK